MSSVFNSAMRLDMYSYSSTMTSCSWRRSFSLLCRMGLSGVRPDVVCYSSALSSFESTDSDWQHAGSALSMMFLRRVAINEVCGNAAIKALDPQWRVALEMSASAFTGLKLAKGVASLISERHDGMWPGCLALLEMHGNRDVFSIGAAMMELQMQQEWHLALNLLQQAFFRSVQADGYVHSLAVVTASTRTWETQLRVVKVVDASNRWFCDSCFCRPISGARGCPCKVRVLRDSRDSGRCQPFVEHTPGGMW